MSKPILTGAALASAKNAIVKEIIKTMSYKELQDTAGYDLSEVDDAAVRLLSLSFDVRY